MQHEAVLPNPVTMQPIKQTIHSWRDGKKFKRENPIRNETVIVDLDKQEVIGINSSTKSYWKMPSAKYQQLALISLVVMGVTATPDGKLNVPDPLFEKTGQTALVEGRKAYEVKVLGTMPNGVATSVWLSEEVDLPIADLVEQLRISLGGPTNPQLEPLFAQWGALKGYPVQNITTIRTQQGEVMTSETLISYKKEKLPASTFEVPKGFALVVDPITQLEQQQARAQGPAGIGAPLKPAAGAGQPVTSESKAKAP